MIFKDPSYPNYRTWDIKLGPALIVSLVVTLILGTFLALTDYQMHRDIEAVSYRAQVAADVPDMLEYMKELKAGLKRHGMTQGHTALIFKTPANDLGLLNKSIDNIINRLENIKNVPTTTVTYQVALDDIRETLKAMEADSDGYLWTQYWYLFLIILVFWIWLLVLFVRDMTE